MKPAVFLDRDGVLIEDVHLLTRPDQLELLPGVPEALTRLHRAGFPLVVVTNQTVVARGLASEQEVEAVHTALARRLQAAGAPALDGWYYCPHHPNATVPRYRMDCDCRKPRPGLLQRAAEDLGLSLPCSVVVGDRLSDVVAGLRAGCRTVLIQTGKHLEEPIESPEPTDGSEQPHWVCADLGAAADWILMAS